MLKNGLHRFIKPVSVLLILLSVLSAHARGYRGEVRHWTKSKQLFSNTDMTLQALIHATYFSPELRQKFVQKHIQKKYLNPEDGAQFSAKQQERQDNYHEFFVGLYAPKPYQLFTMGKESFWELVLTTDSGEVLKPTSIELVDKTPYEHNMFPYLDRWEKPYRILYSKRELGKHFSLTLRSVVGETKLHWKR